MSKIVVTIAGDSGDGVQLLGNMFSDNIAILNYDLNTLPDFPAEIRAPAGTIHGVSGFQIQYGVESVSTAGELSDVLIAFNAAAFKKYIKSLKPTGILIYDASGFDAKNCKLANFDKIDLENVQQRKIEIAFSEMTKESLSGYDITEKDRDKNKNIFALGVLAFAVHSQLDQTQHILSQKFKGSQLEMMNHALSKGFHYAETIELSIDIIREQGDGESKTHLRSISGNKAIALAILSAPKVFGRNVLFAGYPITPASDILHELAKHSFKEVVVRQAEDEISACAMALGASFGGHIGITASSGPGIDLKQETIGLAHMAEMPLLIIDVQRAGPSTGMPTKIEQSDLNVALYGRHGDAPVPVVAIKSPSSAFDTTLKAIEIMIRYQTPVFLLSDSLIANGSELWEIPNLEKREIHFENTIQNAYHRQENEVRPWVSLGEFKSNYIAGGLEKDAQTGVISYDGDNHEIMMNKRLQKIQNIVHSIPEIELEEGSAEKGTLIVSWGSTYGSVKDVFLQMKKEQKQLAHIHLEWILPLPKNAIELMSKYDRILVPELNMGQFADYLSKHIQKPIFKINKVKGTPFFESDLNQNIAQFVSE